MSLLRHSGAALLAALAVPVGGLSLAINSKWRLGLSERLGARKGVSRGGVWLHGASVGEAAVMARLIPGLEAMAGGVNASLTSLSGRDRLHQLSPDTKKALAPLDHPWCVDRVLSALDPAALILVETELWPFLIEGASRRGIPIALVSARLSDRSFQNYLRFRPVFSRSLARIHGIGARSEEDADRFVALGAEESRIEVTGDLKLEPLAEGRFPDVELEEVLAGHPFLVAGSTHSGEESAALAALAACESVGLKLALVLAPRHASRMEEVARSVIDSGRSLKRRSTLSGGGLASGEVLLLDTFGELSFCYERSVGAFVGGTLVDRGGHNLLEPAQFGKPVCFGPYIQNVRESAQLLESSGAGRCVEDPQALAEWAIEIAGWTGSHPAGEAAEHLVKAHSGSLGRTLSFAEPLVSRGVHEGA